MSYFGLRTFSIVSGILATLLRCVLAPSPLLVTRARAGLMEREDMVGRVSGDEGVIFVLVLRCSVD